MNPTLITDAQNTWCPGCGNFSIQHQAKLAILESGIPRENIVLVAGIGCHGKMVDYLDLNSFYAIHGGPSRPPPASRSRVPTSR
jgi:2-oxoglutarate ferredoxin oxidoreductase subunit beta